MEPVLLNPSAGLPRTDYPRPQWKRGEWLSLNGPWQFAFDFSDSGEARGMVEAGEYPLDIQVPFCPESRLSGIGFIDFIPAVWYRRTLRLDTLPAGRALLHFGAVDHRCRVWVNGIAVGGHTGGYTSFTIDITHALRPGENTVVVNARDDQRSGKQPHGKQSGEYRSHACSYTRTTGIWQTVWLEFVPERYLLRPKMTPDAANGALALELRTSADCTGCRLRLQAFYEGRFVGEKTVCVAGDRVSTRLEVTEAHLWAPGDPQLYDLQLELLDPTGTQVLDTVQSYFALRDVTLTKRALAVNGKPVFMRLILDQGFHPDGVYTAPDTAALENDIRLSMALGFNGARLHQRVFEEYTLYLADKLGYIVWGEFAGGTELSDARALEYLLPEWMELLEQQHNHPALIGWCPLNETYHCMVLDENIARLLYRITKTADPSRPVIDASGGVHYETDMFDVHDYEQDPARLQEYLAPMLQDDAVFHSPVERYRGYAPIRPEEYTGQPYWVSEYGGTFWNPQTADQAGWGYGDAPRTEEEFAARYEGLTKTLLQHPRVCGFCYTQLTDIEQEQNGLYRYDRTRKFGDEVYERIRAANLSAAAIEQE